MPKSAPGVIWVPKPIRRSRTIIELGSQTKKQTFVSYAANGSNEPILWKNNVLRAQKVAI